MAKSAKKKAKSKPKAAASRTKKSRSGRPLNTPRQLPLNTKHQKPPLLPKKTKRKSLSTGRKRTLFSLPPNSSDRPISTIPPFVAQFNEKNFPECFRAYAELLHWDHYWHTTLDTSNPPFWKWFVGGKLNACYNCVDRHLAKHKNKAALIFVPEPEDEAATVITYQELYRRVNEVAAMLRDFAGLKAGDRVTIHMPMIPELPITMLACARLGVIHSVVFGGFSGEACGLRAADSGSRVLDLRRRLLPQRQVGRPQSQLRHRGENRRKRRPAHRQSSGLAAATTANTVPNRR